MDQVIIDRYVEIVKTSKTITLGRRSLQESRRLGFLEGVSLIYGEKAVAALIEEADLRLKGKK